MKSKLRQFAIWLLEKTDEVELNFMKVDLETTVNLGKRCPKKDKWYHMAFTVEAFLKRSDKNIEIWDQIVVYRDGKETDRYINNS